MIVKSIDKFERVNAVAVGRIDNVSRRPKRFNVLSKDATGKGYVYFLMHVNITAKRQEDGTFTDKEFEDVVLKIGTKSICYDSTKRLRRGMLVFACGRMDDYNDSGCKELDEHEFLKAEYFVIVEEQLENFIVFTNEKKKIKKKDRKKTITEYLSRAADEETRRELEEIIAEHDDKIVSRKTHEEIMMRTNFHDDYDEDDYDF